MAARNSGYSRLVRVLKVGLPLLAFGLLAAIFLISPKEELEGGLVFQRSDLERLGEGLQVTNPDLSGKTTDGAEYHMTAKRVAPRDNSLRSADFEDIDGKVILPSGVVVTLTAEEADFEVATQALNFPDGVLLTTSDGYRMTARRMTADMRAAVFSGFDGVEATGPEGRITAETMRLEAGEKGGKNQIIYFNRSVRVLINVADMQDSRSESQ